MPRQNATRSIFAERSVAQRILYERKERGMSVEGLAERMKQVGCPIQVSALYRIENANPPRRITVDELVAFSEVFGIPVPELLLPLETVHRRAVVELALQLDTIVRDLRAKATVAYEWSERLANLAYSPSRAAVAGLLGDLTKNLVPEEGEPDNVRWVQSKVGMLILQSIADAAVRLRPEGDSPWTFLVPTVEES